MNRKISSLGLLGVLIAAFQNCAPAEFKMYPGESNSAAGVPEPNVVTPQPTPALPGVIEGNVDTIKKACECNPQKKTLLVQFKNPVDPKDPRKTCPFGIDDNWKTAPERMQARVEQNFDFDIPAGATLCSLKMKFPDQKFKFDDMFFLSLNNVVLASSSPIDKYSAPVDGLIPYEWSKIRGQRFDNVAYQYCLGAKDKLATCVWPKTETTGAIKMDFAPSIFYRIAAEDPSRTRHQLKMTTTGDDNPEIDCQHDPISFELEVSYAN